MNVWATLLVPACGHQAGQLLPPNGSWTFSLPKIIPIYPEVPVHYLFSVTHLSIYLFIYLFSTVHTLLYIPFALTYKPLLFIHFVFLFHAYKEHL